MSIDSDLRRLDEIIGKLTGDKALRDEAKAIVRRMIDAQARDNTTTQWWRENPPIRPLSQKVHDCVDFVVVNDGATDEEIAVQLGIGRDNARRLVHRADDQLLERVRKVSISWDGSGVARTATTSIVVSAITPSPDRTKLS